MGVSVNVSCLLSILIHPYMPTTSETIRKQLNVSETSLVLPERIMCFLPAGHIIGKVMSCE